MNVESFDADVRGFSCSVGWTDEAIAPNSVAVGAAKLEAGARVVLAVAGEEGKSLIAVMTQPDVAKLLVLLHRSCQRCADLTPVVPQHEPEVRK